MSGEKLSLYTSIAVNKRPRTDNESVLTEKITLITNKQISTGKLADFTQLVKDMGVCGIVIGDNRIALKADQVKVLNGNDEVAMFEGGKLNANFIDAQTIVVNGLQANGIQGNTIDAKNATISNLNVNNIKLSGSFRSPFVPVGGGYESKFADNISLVTNQGELNLHIKSTSLDQVGRVVHLTHYKWNEKTASFGNIYVDVPDGFYFYENGVAFKKIRISRECVTLLGLGDDKKFYGWCVIGRCDLMTNRAYGRTKKVLAYGRVNGTSSGASITYRTFDGSTLSVTRLGTGVYEIKAPRKWFLGKEDGILKLDSVFVTLTGIGSSYDDNQHVSPIKATFWGATKDEIFGVDIPYNICIEVHTSNDNSVNDGSFNFEISNFDDFDYFASSSIDLT